jgi:glutamine amidotransferase
MLYLEDERSSHFSHGARAVVSEPLVDLHGTWREVPAGSALVIGDDIEEQGLQPTSPAMS